MVEDEIEKLLAANDAAGLAACLRAMCQVAEWALPLTDAAPPAEIAPLVGSMRAAIKREAANG